jgi:Protein of unknown function DUF45
LQVESLAILAAALSLQRIPPLPGALIRWYRRQAEQRLPRFVEPWAKKLMISAPTVLVRDQQRRGGSCNQTGEVRLNWRIIQAPLALIDYVIAHELSHLVGGDDGHGPEFWARLGLAMPDYDLRRDRFASSARSLSGERGSRLARGTEVFFTGHACGIGIAEDLLAGFSVSIIDAL